MKKETIIQKNENYKESIKALKFINTLSFEDYVWLASYDSLQDLFIGLCLECYISYSEKFGLSKTNLTDKEVLVAIRIKTNSLLNDIIIVIESNKYNLFSMKLNKINDFEDYMRI